MWISGGTNQGVISVNSEPKSSKEEGSRLAQGFFQRLPVSDDPPGYWRHFPVREQDASPIHESLSRSDNTLARYRFATTDKGRTVTRQTPPPQAAACGGARVQASNWPTVAARAALIHKRHWTRARRIVRLNVREIKAGPAN
jgi:hypothetical protein